jgi:hypothetical protein
VVVEKVVVAVAPMQMTRLIYKGTEWINMSTPPKTNDLQLTENKL